MKNEAKIDGVFLVDKPKGFTSHDIVAITRGALGTKKVGHCGTLDPNATGLLVLVVGVATKFSSHLTGNEKSYQGIIRLGQETNTYDSEGDVTSESPVPALNLESIQKECEQFNGDIEQIPPMVSAIKKDGVPLYKLARKGVEVKREPRAVTITNFDITDYTEPDIHFEIHCSKGTYVRSVAHDLGRSLECGAHLLELRRTRSGKFSVDKAVDGASLKTMPRDEARSRLLSLSDLLQIYSPEELTGKKSGNANPSSRSSIGSSSPTRAL